LAHAYDSLVEILNSREVLIEKRIKDQINHLGMEERVFFEEKDWSKENEDLKNINDPFSDTYKIEHILSVNEQIRNIDEVKNMSPEDRFYRFVTMSYDPTT
jgi:hypothetical protein